VSKIGPGTTLAMCFLAAVMLAPIAVVLDDFVFVVHQRTWDWEGDYLVGTDNWKDREEIRRNDGLRKHLFETDVALRDFDPTEMWISMTSPISRRFVRWAIRK
jgi:hypothetical protein